MSPECEKLVGRKRIRKEVNRLTPIEKFHLNFALKLAMASAPYYPKNKLLFGDIANYHGAPYTICTGGPCCPHADRLPQFLVWHRLYTGKLTRPWPFLVVNVICFIEKNLKNFEIFFFEF